MAGQALLHTQRLNRKSCWLPTDRFFNIQFFVIFKASESFPVSNKAGQLIIEYKYLELGGRKC